MIYFVSHDDGGSIILASNIGLQGAHALCLLLDRSYSKYGQVK